MRKAALIPLLSGALAGCGIDFVEVERRPVTNVTVTTEHRDGLSASVQVVTFDVIQPPVVVVSGDTLEAELLPDGRAFQTISLAPDSLDPFVDLRIESEQGTLAMRIPALMRAGPAARRDDGDVTLPFLLPEGGVALEAAQWTIGFFHATGQPTLQIQGFGPPPDSLVFPPALVPAAGGRADMTIVLVPPSETSWVAVVVIGRAIFTIPAD